MDGLHEIRRANEQPRDAHVRQVRLNTAEWLRRARVALDTGDYELCRNLAQRAAQEVEGLLSPADRAA